jgi:hypothetical protein
LGIIASMIVSEKEKDTHHDSTKKYQQERSLFHILRVFKRKPQSEVIVKNGMLLKTSILVQSLVRSYLEMNDTMLYVSLSIASKAAMYY